MMPGSATAEGEEAAKILGKIVYKYEICIIDGVDVASLFVLIREIKEGCKRGHGLTASFKQGSLKKSVAAYFIALWCVLSSVLFL